MNCDSSVPEAFSRAAETYSTAACVQREVAKTLLAQIETEAKPRRILELGCGTGLLTEGVSNRFAESEVIAVDNAEEMLRVAKLRCVAPQIRWHLADVRSLDLGEQFDSVFSSSALHWMIPYHQAFRTIRRHLAPSAKAHLAIMLEGTLRELHDLRENSNGIPAAQQRLPSENELSAIMEESGLLIENCYLRTFSQRHTNSRAFFRDLKRLGLTGGVFSRGERLLTRSELRALMSEYDVRNASAEGDVTSSYQVGFFKLRRGA